MLKCIVVMVCEGEQHPAGGDRRGELFVLCVFACLYQGMRSIVLIERNTVTILV